MVRISRNITEFQQFLKAIFFFKKILNLIQPVMSQISFFLWFSVKLRSQLKALVREMKNGYEDWGKVKQ